MGYVLYLWSLWRMAIKNNHTIIRLEVQEKVSAALSWKLCYRNQYRAMIFYGKMIVKCRYSGYNILYHYILREAYD